MAANNKPPVADGEEVLQYLSALLRGQEAEGEGPPAPRDRLKAAELLGKRYGLFTDRVSPEGGLPVAIIDDITAETPAAPPGGEATADEDG